MDTAQHTFPLWVIVPDIAKNLMQRRNVDEKKAFELIYTSRLFKLLEDKETGMWHLSPLALCELLCEELDTGKITIPEEQS